jgi:hypothetical protein
MSFDDLPQFLKTSCRPAPKSGRLPSPAWLIKKEFGERRTPVLEREAPAG